MENMIIGHEHIMDEDCICPKFVGSRVLQWMVNTFTMPFSILLRSIIPFTSRDVLSRYAAFIENENKTQEENFKELKGYYPDDSKFVVLTVNMNGMGAGKTKKSYEEQLQEVIKMKQSGENILLFYHLDPTISDSLDMLYKYQEYIDGLKVYTLMGHFPYHPKLMKAYEWCNENSKPVVFHTSPDSPVYYKGKKKEIKRRLLSSVSPLYDTGNKKSELCRNFTNPRAYEHVLIMFPNVNFDFAHLAGDVEIEKYWDGKSSMSSELLDMCKKYKNAYFDISYSFSSTKNQRILALLMQDEKLSKKVLNGTDFYMNKTAAKQKDYIEKLKKNIGTENFNKISKINPRIFHRID